MKLRDPAFEKAVIAGCEEELKKTPSLWAEYRRRRFWERLALGAFFVVAGGFCVWLAVRWNASPSVLVWEEFVTVVRCIAYGVTLLGLILGWLITRGSTNRSLLRGPIGINHVRKITLRNLLVATVLGVAFSVASLAVALGTFTDPRALLPLCLPFGFALAAAAVIPGLALISLVFRLGSAGELVRSVNRRRALRDQIPLRQSVIVVLVVYGLIAFALAPWLILQNDRLEHLHGPILQWFALLPADQVAIRFLESIEQRSLRPLGELEVMIPLLLLGVLSLQRIFARMRYDDLLEKDGRVVDSSSSRESNSLDLKAELEAPATGGAHWTLRILAGRITAEEQRYLRAAYPSGVVGTGYIKVLMLLCLLVVAAPVNTGGFALGAVVIGGLLLLSAILVPAIAAAEVSAPIDLIRAGALPGDPIRVARLSVQCGLRMVLVSFGFAVALIPELMWRLFFYRLPDPVWWLISIVMVTVASALPIPGVPAFRLIACSGAINPFTKIGRRGLSIVLTPLLMVALLLVLAAEVSESLVAIAGAVLVAGIVVWLELALGIRAFARGRL